MSFYSIFLLLTSPKIKRFLYLYKIKTHQIIKLHIVTFQDAYRDEDVDFNKKEKGQKPDPFHPFSHSRKVNHL